MRASSLRPPPGPLSRSRARNSALINQCATPGLGSLLAGRYVAGAGQLLLAVAGFGLLLVWWGLLMFQLYHQITDNAEPTKSVAWLGEVGAACFALAWVWSLITSVSLLREARAAAPEPPRLG